MTNTFFQVPKEKIKHFTVGYGWNNDSLFIAENATDNRYVHEVTLFNEGRGLVSTTFDYLRFCQMLLNKGELGNQRILKESTLDLMLSDQLADVRAYQSERMRLPQGEASFGLGFTIRGESINSQEKVYG